MGLKISANYKNAPTLYGGYGMLLTFRKVVATAYDKELGEYIKLLNGAMTSDEIKEWNKKVNKMLKDPRFKEQDYDILDFLFAPDDGGSMSGKTAKKVYELIKDIHPKRYLRYAAYSKNDWEDIKELLLGCYKKRSKFYWR